MTLYQALDTEVIRPCLDIASKALQMEESLHEFWFSEGQGANILRLARYLPRTGENEREVLYGEHTDYHGLTFLWRNQTNGLQEVSAYCLVHSIRGIFRKYLGCV